MSARFEPPLDLTKPGNPTGYFTGLPRSPESLLRVVEILHPETAGRYQKRDVTGDGVDETFCNFFVRDALACMGVGVPRVRANDLCAWLSNSSDWRQVVASEALERAAAGFPVVAGWVNPKGGSGHVALCIPTPAGRFGVWIAQAGKSNFNAAAVAQGFGRVVVSYWTHN